MKYSLGEGLADFGFSFLEKVHEPIFLIKKSGLLVNINEAGRKLMRVGGITRAELESYIKWKFAAQLTSVKGTAAAQDRAAQDRATSAVQGFQSTQNNPVCIIRPTCNL